MRSASLTLITLSISLLIGVLNACNSRPHLESLERDSSPQAVTFINDKIIAVTDTAYINGEWGEGRVVLINTETKSTVSAWYTPFGNPQEMLHHQNYLTVLSSGPLSLDGQAHGEISAISRYEISSDLDSNPQAARLRRQSVLSSISEVWFDNEAKGAYLVDLSVSTHSEGMDHTFWMTSGIDGLLWRLNQSAWENEISSSITVHRFVDDQSLSLSAVEIWKDKVIVVEFNQDRLFLFDSSTGERLPCSPELGQYEGVMEGAQTPFVKGDRLWVSFGLSGRLIHIDLNELDLDNEECRVEPLVYEPPLGQVPNDLLVTGDQVFVLHSVESALWRYDSQSGELLERRPLPLQTNPWHMALSDDKDELMVTEWLRGGLTSLSLDRTGRVEQLSSRLIAPAIPPSCQRPTEASLFTARGLIVPTEGLVLHWDELTSESGVDPRLLRAAPQLALAFAEESGPAIIEFKERAEDEWRALTSLSNLLAGNLALTQDEDLDTSNEQRDILVSPVTDMSLGRFNSKVMMNGQDSCDLFLPKYGALRLSLFDESAYARDQERSEIESLRSGKVGLHSIKITPSTEREVRLTSAVFRRW